MKLSRYNFGQSISILTIFSSKFLIKFQTFQSSLGEKLTNEEVDILLQGQEDANGNVNYDKFIKTLMSDKEGVAE